MHKSFVAKSILPREHRIYILSHSSALVVLLLLPYDSNQYKSVTSVVLEVFLVPLINLIGIEGDIGHLLRGGTKSILESMFGPGTLLPNPVFP